jgi:hypothetical protein
VGRRAQRLIASRRSSSRDLLYRVNAMINHSATSTFQFTLIVAGPDLQSDDMMNAIFDAGCDDALVGSVDGIQYLDFDRESDSLGSAILSAIADVESVADTEVVRIADAGLVSMASIAAQTGRTRESVRLLVAGERGPGGFPPPVTDPRNRYRLWRSTDVDSWFACEYDALPHTLDTQLLAAINAGLELRRYSRTNSDEHQVILRMLIDL